MDQRTEWFRQRMRELSAHWATSDTRVQPAETGKSGMARRQAGFGLVDALVAVVIFGFGMAVLAALYVRMAPQPYQNIAVTQIQGAANSLIGALTVNPSVLPVNASNVSVATGLPSALQPWFTQSSASLPGFAVSIASGPNAAGNACSPASCGVTFSLSWTQLGITRQQTFYAQIGIS